MKVNFDGMRRNATRCMNMLNAVIQDSIESGGIYSTEQANIVEAFNNAASAVDIFNAIFDDEINDDINDLSSELEIKRLTILKECHRCGEMKDEDDFASEDMCFSCYEEEF